MVRQIREVETYLVQIGHILDKQEGDKMLGDWDLPAIVQQATFWNHQVFSLMLFCMTHNWHNSNFGLVTAFV